MKTARLILLLVALLLVPHLCQAQWRTQTIQLQPGWNAVHLEVQPQPDDCDTILANLPIESVWKWNRRFSTIQFVTDPSKLVPEDPDWLVWLPLTDKKVFLRRLRSIEANQSYLIKLADDASPVTLSIKGQVVLPKLEWYPHGLNLVGFPVNSINSPTFTEFFKFTTEVNTTLGYANQLFRLDSAGHGLAIVQPARDRVQPGVAYWIRTEKKPAYMASLHVNASGGAIDFGAIASSQDMTILNAHPTAPTQVMIKLRNSESPPTGTGFPELAGSVPLSYLSQNTNGSWDWIEFPASGLSKTLAPGQTWTLRLGLRRAALASYQPTGTNGADYQGILEVTDAAQSLLIPVPVTATRPEIVAASKASNLNGALDEFNENAGLWIGQATLNQVNAPAYTTNTVIPTPAPMSLRLILHLDNTGQARLLQEVLLVWDPTLTDPPHTNGTYALYASEQALPSNATDVKRITSVGFPIMSPVPMSGNLTNELGGTVNIGFGDPTNPFLHRYHPMHDNKDWDFVAYTNAVEVPNITREITMDFTTVTNATADPIWGVDAVAGTYTETLLGLRAQPIVMTGPFALQRISRIDQLQGITP
jgi:hypothetical protein